MASKHMPVDLVEAAVGEGPRKPAPVGRVIGVETARPGHVTGPQVERTRRAGRAIPAGPGLRIGIEIAPCRQLGQVPADRRARLLPMKGTWIGYAGVAHRIPAGLIGQRVAAGWNGGGCHRNQRRQRTGLIRREVGNEGISSQLSSRSGPARFPNRVSRFRRTKQMSPEAGIP